MISITWINITIYLTYPYVSLDDVPVLVVLQEMELQSGVSPRQVGGEFESYFISDLVNVEDFT